MRILQGCEIISVKLKESSKMPFSQFSLQDPLYFKRWLANSSEFLQGKDIRCIDALFGGLIISVCGFAITSDPSESQSLQLKLNDYLLFEVACYAISHCDLWLTRDFESIGTDITDYFKLRLVFLTNEATGVGSRHLLWRRLILREVSLRKSRSTPPFRLASK